MEKQFFRTRRCRGLFLVAGMIFLTYTRTAGAPPEDEHSPEEEIALVEWFESLPVGTPPDGRGGGGGGFCATTCLSYDSDTGRCVPNSQCNWVDYVDFNRDQQGGTCWVWASTGVLEIQYMIQCCEKNFCPGIETDCSSAHPQNATETWLHLSEFILDACTGNSRGSMESIEEFITNVGTTYVEYQPWQDAVIDPIYSLPLPWYETCPLQDRGRVETDSFGNLVAVWDRNGTSDVFDIWNNMNPIVWPDLEPHFFKAIPYGSDPTKSMERVDIDLSTEATQLNSQATVKQWIANGYPLYCGDGSHAMVLYGYEQISTTELKLIFRNSWGTWSNPEETIWDASTPKAPWEPPDYCTWINGVEKYLGSDTTSPLNEWLKADADGDGIKNVYDYCLYSRPFNLDTKVFEPGLWNPVSEDYSGDWVPAAQDNDGDMFPDDGYPDPTYKACDKCPGIPHYYMYGPADGDSDGVQNICDNCRDIPNFDQSNCSYNYEVLHGFADPGTPDLEGELGDACDPDPCISPCSEPDRYGECGPETEPWIYPSDWMFRLFTDVGNRYTVDYFTKGYNVGPDGSPIEEPRDELMQIHWCSCKVIDGPGWLSEETCKTFYCRENGDENPDPYFKTGWFGTILQDRPVAAKSIDDVTVYESVPFNSPFHIDSRYIREEVILWRDSRLQYPAGTPSDENYLRFWLRPINRDHYISTSEEEKRPPSSERFGGLPPQDWNNTYIPKTYLHYMESGWGRDIIIAQESRWASVPMIDSWTKRHPGVEKIEEWLPWLKDHECGTPWDYVQQPPGSALTGIAFMKVEPWRMGIPEILPSQAAVNEVPGEKGMAFARMSWEGAVAPLATAFVAFGGVNAAGEYSSALWTAERHGPAVGEPSDSELLFLWRRVNGYEGLRPEGRSNPAIFTIPGSQEIFVYAGQGETGYLGDLWAFSPGAAAPYADGMTAAEAVADGGGTWSMVQTFGDVPSPRARFSTVQMNNEVYIYGGHTAGGVSGELFLLHLPEGRFEMIYPDFSSPGPRTGASLAIDPGGVLYLFGGYDGAAFRNDLWSFDLGNRSWVEILPDCLSGSCPPALDWPTLIRDQWSGSLAVFTSMASAGGDLYWIPTDRGWVGQRFIEGTPDAGDCDGDGTEDANFGHLCPTGDAWWSYPGRMVCDTWEPAVACSPSDVSGGEISRIHLPSARSFDVEGSMLCAAHDAKLSCYDLTNPSSPSLVGSLSLHRTAWGVDIVGNFAYVAAEREIMAVDISDPSSPFVTSHLPTCGTAFDIGIEDDILTVTSSGGLGAAYITRPGEFAGAGFLWISRHGGSIETEVGSMQQCAELSWWEQAWIDMRAFLGGIGFPRADLLERRVYVSSGRNVMVVGVESPMKPGLLGTYDISLPVQDLKIDGDLLYLNLAGHQRRAASRIILDVSDPASIFKAGTHDVATWVRGLLLDGNKAFILDKPHIKIAEVHMPPGGW